MLTHFGYYRTYRYITKVTDSNCLTYVRKTKQQTSLNKPSKQDNINIRE